MGDVETLQGLLRDVQRGLNGLDAEIKAKREGLERAEAQRQEDRATLDALIAQKTELADVLDNCAVEVCKYKNEFEEITKKQAGQAESSVLSKPFHFFLCFRSQYLAGGKTVIEAHREVIDRYGYCWWGKFYSERKPSGSYRNLEPFGESIRWQTDSPVAQRIKEQVEKRCQTGDSVYLYLCDPNPPNWSLFVARVEEFVFGQESLPHYEEDGARLRDCSKIPDYYFASKLNCTSCKKHDSAHCIPRFKCNFWFKVVDIVKLDNMEDEFTNLVNCFTEDTINFAIPILYPLLVYQARDRYHFHERDVPIPSQAPIEFRIKGGEAAHTDVPKVKQFFEKLNNSCGGCLLVVESIPFAGQQADAYTARVGTELDQIVVNLPHQYRHNQSPSSYRLLLDKRTQPQQRDRALGMIQEYLGGL